MKTISLLFAFLGIAFFTHAQINGENADEPIRTIFGSNRSSMGGYGGFGAAYSVIDGKAGFVSTARGALIIDRSLALGFAGAGFINDIHYNSYLNSDVNLTGGYGGFLIEPIIFPKMPVHITFPLIGGVGAVAYTRNLLNHEMERHWESYVEDTHFFLVGEPGVEMEFNVLRFFRFSLIASYRFTSKLRLMDTPGNALEGFTTGFNLKFGKF